MSCNLNQIEKVCRSVGGLRSVKVLRPEGVEQDVVQYCNGTASGNLVLADGHEYVNMPFSPGSAEMRERLVSGNRAGDFYETEVVFFLPVDRVDVAGFLEAVKNSRLHVSTTDRNGATRLLRSMRLESEFSTGGRNADKNGHRIRFVGQGKKKAPLWDSTTYFIITGGVAQLNPQAWTDSDGAWQDAPGDEWVTQQ